MRLGSDTAQVRGTVNANADGSVAESLDYSAFGDRRSYSDSNASGTAAINTPRGFTGHETIDGTGVIHMNGRIYDQQLGRFLQADRVIQAPGSRQCAELECLYLCVQPSVGVYGSDGEHIVQTNSWNRDCCGLLVFHPGSEWCNDDCRLLRGYGNRIRFNVCGNRKNLRASVLGAITARQTYGVGWATSGWAVGGKMAAQAFTGGIVEM